MPRSLVQRFVFLMIVLSYWGLGVLFAMRTPAWQAPDEPAHYNYILQIANGDPLPIIEMGDWNNDYLETLKAQDFAPELLDDLATVEYENHQPPLYYWWGTFVFWLTDGNLIAMRLYSVLLGTLTLMFSYRCARLVMPEREHAALAVMLLVAFIPQNLHITSSVNNDALANALIASLLLWSLRALRNADLPAGQFGYFVGLMFITKTTGYFMAGVTIFVLMARVWLHKRADQTLLSGWLLELPYFFVGGIFAILYWGRNLHVYGWPDFLGLIRHDEVVVGQLRRADYVASIGTQTYWNEAVSTTFNSFWGQFGWMEAPLFDALPTLEILILGILMLSIIGLLRYSISIGKVLQQIAHPARVAITIWISLGLVMLFTLLQYIFFNITFVQFQGRYLFTALIPIAIILTLGLDFWRTLIPERFWVRDWLLVALFSTLIPLNLYLIWRVIPGAVGGLMP